MQQSDRYQTPTLHVPVTAQPQMTVNDPLAKANFYDIEVGDPHNDPGPILSNRVTLCPHTQHQQSGQPTLLNNGVYRQRSYDNLQNGKSSSMQSLTRFVHLPRSSCDHIADLAPGAPMHALFGGLGIGNGNGNVAGGLHTVGGTIAAMSSDASSSSSSPSPSAPQPPAAAAMAALALATAGAHSTVSVDPVPTHFQYFAPQQQHYHHHYHHQHRRSVCDAPTIGAYSRYPYHKNRAVPRRPLPTLPLISAQPAAPPTQQQQILSGTSADDIRVYMDVNSPSALEPTAPPTLTDPMLVPAPPLLHNVYRYSRRHHHHQRSNTPNRYQQRRKSSALSLLKDLDFIDESEDDPMLKDCNQFRVTRAQQYVNGSSGYDRDDRSPLKKKQRYSNIYDYSFNLSLNSIHEDSTSDDSL